MAARFFGADEYLKLQAGEMMGVSLKSRIGLQFSMSSFLRKRSSAGNTRHLPWGASWALQYCSEGKFLGLTLEIMDSMLTIVGQVCDVVPHEIMAIVLEQFSLKRIVLRCTLF